MDERRFDVAVGQIEGELLAKQRGKRLANHHVDVPIRSVRRVRLAKERSDGVGLRIGENDLATVDSIHDSKPVIDVFLAVIANAVAAILDVVDDVFLHGFLDHL